MCYLRESLFEAALERVRHHIPLYNRTCGDPTGYHETITVLFLRRVARYLREKPTVPPLVAAVEELASEFDMQWVGRFYSPELLWSDEARSGWVELDLKPLDF